MAEQSDILDAVNKRTYASSKVVRWYDQLDFIHKPEAVILENLLPTIKGKKLLDIGIGGGRTTRFLLEISKDYTGIDYTPACVEVAKTKYPSANISCKDARDLSAFANDGFDFVLFALNGIDYVTHDDRLKVFQEIRRVLRPGAPFAFSTHNRDYRHFKKLPWQQGVPFDLNLVKNSLYTLAFLPRHFRMQKYEVHNDGYAIVNDNAHGFSLLAYYIGVEQQKAQLKSAGFIEVDVYDMEGKIVERDREFPWTYYLARKPPS